MVDVTIKHNNIGQCVTIQCKYEDMEVLSYPENCRSCPVGFMNNCGRPKDISNIKERPYTCKLKLVDISKVL